MLRIVGIGEAIFDVYSENEKYPGGVPVNCAVHASQLGHQGILVSRVGTDANGNEMRTELTRRGVDTRFVQTDPKTPTAQVTLQIGADGTPVFVCHQKLRAFHFLQNQPEWVQIEPDAIVFTVSGQLAPVAGVAIQRFLKASTAFKLLDVNAYFVSKRTIEILTESLNLANGLKLNSAELATVAKIVDIQGSQIIPKLMQLFNLDLVLHTKGAAGAEIFTQTQKYQMSALNPSPRDTNGCGDAFATAALILFLLNRPIEEIAIAASQLAAFVAQARGAVPVYHITDRDFDKLFVQPE